MSKADHRLGLQPSVKRLAFEAMLKGVGTHPLDHPEYDQAVVKQLYAWRTSPDEDAVPSQGAVTVELFRAGRRVRWIEFGCRAIGGGGEPIVKDAG